MHQPSANLITDIVNHSLATLTNCEAEPIHIPGSIQQHGCLLAVNKESEIVCYCSANTGTWLGVEPVEMLNHPVSDIFSVKVVEDFRNYVKDIDSDIRHPLMLVHLDHHYITTIHSRDNYWIIEFEKAAVEKSSITYLYDQTRHFVRYLESSLTLQEHCRVIAEEIRDVTGYDRVMVYRFDEHYNGEVYAESCDSHISPLLGHHYPHTDIPSQARQLYMTNLSRMIADVRYSPVPLLTTIDRKDHQLDLSTSVLRSVSPIHIEYLQNLGIGATLTLSLLLGGKLWGLIACHHYSPKLIDHYTRTAAQLQAHFLTSQIRVREIAEEYKVSEDISVYATQLHHLLGMEENFFNEKNLGELLISLTNATGCVILFDNKINAYGITPPESSVKELIGYCIHSGKDTLDTYHLTSLLQLPPISGLEYAAGMIYYRGASFEIAWFREEKEKALHWAGDPTKITLKGEDGMRLTPRKSFENWKQIVKGQSVPWRKAEISAALSFAYALQKLFHVLQIRKEEQQHRAMTNELRKVNEELSSINWIGTHDLKEPLRKILIISSLLEREEISVEARRLLERLQMSTDRLRQLIDNILAYSKISQRNITFQECNLHDIVQQEADRLNTLYQNDRIVFSIGKLPVILGIPDLLTQLFKQLLDNALKFTSDVQQICITITAKEKGNVPYLKLPGLFYQVTVSDNGIGFEEQYMAKIFKLFQRLHAQDKYIGTGIGLSISQKIMDMHQGHITASSIPGQGSSFNLFFPVSINI